MNGIAVLLIGLLLCFYGIRSLHLGILAIGFGLGWMLADLFHASLSALLLFGLIGAVSAWIVTTLVFKFSAYFIGGLTGAMAGARAADVLQPGDNDWALSAIVILAVAVAAAFLADKYRARALLWLTSIGGASMILNGLGRTTDALEFLRNPQPGWQQIFATAAWIALSVAGWIVQRHLFADKLGIKNTLVGNASPEADKS
ncbi:DUF4203 domain-containing protein [Rhodococcus erythropolis]|uniref:DUF4203 domain-containing protein n=1 Tax=Rhodococcus erythropolis TaxID=1833 RepID=UPI0012912064|nr:DUF4203 domain-containing protein [Rhodococcus erythropolis]MQP33225.1 DUF4203 domain-containing protein [Rhodococcus erythropolis]